MIQHRWKFTFNLTRLCAIDDSEYSVAYRNRLYLTIKGWAGLYLINIILFNRKLWFGFIREGRWVGSHA